MGFADLFKSTASGLGSAVKSTGSEVKKKKKETASSGTVPTDFGTEYTPSNSITNGGALNGWQLAEQAGGTTGGSSSMLSGIGAAI